MKKGFLVALVVTLMMSVTNVSAMTKDELKTIIEKELFDKYVKKYKTEKGILLKRRLYGIIAKK